VHFTFYTFLSVSRHILGLTVFVSHFPCFSVFSPKSRYYSVYFSYFTSFCFSPFSWSYSVCFSLLHFFPYFSSYSRSYQDYLIFSLVSFLNIFKGLQCVFLIFHVFQVSPDIPGSTVSISHFSSFLVLLSIFQVIQYLCIIFHVFQFSFHNPGPPVCISNIYRFSLFLAIFHVVQSVFLISHVFHCFLPYFMSYNVSFSFSSFFSFLAKFQFLKSV
jgi:hypothetical protein